MYKSIETLYGSDFDYRCHNTITEKNFTSAYVTSYADIPDRCHMDSYGEDYHDADEVLVWASHISTIKEMGWDNASQMVRELNKRYKNGKFRKV
jgi:hypothetical protein